ncbi:MAG: transcriptional coactivator p15/PC4 family protein [Elusimicrobia bacterium]|nr:transcriptional coactivator p15/PC4 family protein [Elusimicrobiota bacterium]
MTEFAKNSCEKVRVLLKNWQGKELLDLRVFAQNKDGTWVPTAKGLCLQTCQLNDLKAAVKVLESALAQEDVV